MELGLWEPRMGFDVFETAINEFLFPRAIEFAGFEDTRIVGTKPTTPTAVSRAALIAAECIIIGSVVVSKLPLERGQRVACDTYSEAFLYVSPFSQKFFRDDRPTEVCICCLKIFELVICIVATTLNFCKAVVLRRHEKGWLPLEATLLRREAKAPYSTTLTRSRSSRLYSSLASGEYPRNAGMSWVFSMTLTS